MNPPTTIPVEAPVLALPPRITAALCELHAQRSAIRLPAAHDTLAWIGTATRLMLIAARLSAWWELLARWIATESDLPVLLARAATIASHYELDETTRHRELLTHLTGRGGGGR